MTVEPVAPTAADIGALTDVVVSDSPEVVLAVVVLAFEDFETGGQMTNIDFVTTELELVDLPSEGVNNSLVTVEYFGMELIVEAAQVAVVAAPQVG